MWISVGFNAQMDDKQKPHCSSALKFSKRKLQIVCFHYSVCSSHGPFWDLLDRDGKKWHFPFWLLRYIAQIEWRKIFSHLNWNKQTISSIHSFIQHLIQRNFVCPRFFGQKCVKRKNARERSVQTRKYKILRIETSFYNNKTNVDSSARKKEKSNKTKDV